MRSGGAGGVAWAQEAAAAARQRRAAEEMYGGASGTAHVLITRFGFSRSAAAVGGACHQR